MSITTGTALGSYEILGLLGAGGMGEVFHARDQRDGSEVAIKVLHADAAADPDRQARFRREARVLEALDHPNIARLRALEEADGVQFLVMELVQGATLAERITSGGLPVADALRIGGQLASALEAAHEKGVIHRDLKPANIKLTLQGQVKVLDFGLAKAFPVIVAGQDPLAVPTLSVERTQEGMILGTPAYMAPEQARGKLVDRRADVWAFGCVLFESLTGRRAFPGESITETLSAVLVDEPNWENLPAAVPARIRELLQRCLKKDPERRLRDIRDLRLEIEEWLEHPELACNANGAIVTSPPINGVLPGYAQTIVDRPPSPGGVTLASPSATLPVSDLPMLAPARSRKQLFMIVGFTSLAAAVIGVLLFKSLGGDKTSNSSPPTLQEQIDAMPDAMNQLNRMMPQMMELQKDMMRQLPNFGPGFGPGFPKDFDKKPDGFPGFPGGFDKIPGGFDGLPGIDK